MSNPEDADSAVEDYRKLIGLLESNLKYLRSIDVDPKLIDSYRRLLHYLKIRPTNQIPELLGLHAKGSSHYTAENLLSEEEMLSMTGDQVTKYASDPKFPRKQLERIATIRFGVTRGGLSTLKNREALVQKLLTLVSNEGTHDSIARAADSLRDSMQ